MKKWLLIPILAIPCLGVLLYFSIYRGGAAERYRFTDIMKGDVELVVTSAGMLKAVSTVQVGTQVSGIISKIFVDFNDQVDAGKVVAQIDTALLDIAVRDADANLERSVAQLKLAEQTFSRVQRLYAQKIVTETEFIEAQYNFEIAAAVRKSSEVNLEKAKHNLAYATIYAPISGTVIERNVNVGQTVAASFSAPQLFLIANDLTRMQIEVAVDESDIGLIKQGQSARFSVQAFPDSQFDGKVRQVRLQSKVEENVVNYTVIVDVDNSERKLLPGMTATVDFVIEKASDVFKVSNSALRFRPTEAMLSQLRTRPQKNAPAEQPDTSQGSHRWAQTEKDNRARLWYLDNDNRLNVIPVETGISDGQLTEIKTENNIIAGMKVIVGVIRQSVDTTSNPFQNSSSPRRRGEF